jgi:hypothetical protein
MRCVHMHRKISAIEGWGSPNHIWKVMKKIGIENWKAGKTHQVVGEMSTLKLKHNKIQAQWDSDILLESMLKKV